MLSQIMVKSVKSVKKELCIYYTLFSYLWKGSRKGHSAEALFESELSIPCARTELAHKHETMEGETFEMLLPVQIPHCFLSSFLT